MTSEGVPFSPPDLTDEEVAEVAAAVRSGWITSGPRVQELERAFASFVDAPAALAVNSCTAALHLALVSAGCRPGDVVITTPYTFASTVHSILHSGARPVLVDVEDGGFNIDVGRAKQVAAAVRAADSSALTPGERRAVDPASVPNLRAVLPVHFAGAPCDVDGLLELAALHEVPLIEDAAHSLPATWGSHRIGGSASHGTRGATCFSFYATKNMTTGEGGMLTGGEELVQRARLLSLHGMDRDAWGRYGPGGTWQYDVIAPGFKYNMTDIQAAMGNVQLRRLESLHRRRTEITHEYDSAFGDVDELEVPPRTSHGTSAHHLYPLRIRRSVVSPTRDELIAELSARHVSTSVHFIPVHMFSWYRDTFGYEIGDFPNAEDAFRREVSIPLFSAMSGRNVADVIAAVKNGLRALNRA